MQYLYYQLHKIINDKSDSIHIYMYIYFIRAVVTGYSPSVVALTDMLRTQLSITQSLVAQTRQLAATVSSSITPNYHYTTLEETKQVNRLDSRLKTLHLCMKPQ